MSKHWFLSSPNTLFSCHSSDLPLACSAAAKGRRDQAEDFHKQESEWVGKGPHRWTSQPQAPPLEKGWWSWVCFQLLIQQPGQLWKQASEERGKNQWAQAYSSWHISVARWCQNEQAKIWVLRIYSTIKTQADGKGGAYFTNSSIPLSKYYSWELFLGSPVYCHQASVQQQIFCNLKS